MNKYSNFMSAAIKVTMDQVLVHQKNGGKGAVIHGRAGCGKTSVILDLKWYFKHYKIDAVEVESRSSIHGAMRAAGKIFPEAYLLCEAHDSDAYTDSEFDNSILHVFMQKDPGLVEANQDFSSIENRIEGLTKAEIKEALLARCAMIRSGLSTTSPFSI